MTRIKTLTITFLALTLGACGSSPARTQTTTTESTQRTEGGGEVRHESTETTEVQTEGAHTTEHTETTHTTTPAN